MERKASEQRLFIRGASGRIGAEIERMLKRAPGAHEPTGEGLEVTDETRRDRETSGPDRDDDALAEWFRPQEDEGARPGPEADADEPVAGEGDGAAAEADQTGDRGGHGDDREGADGSDDANGLTQIVDRASTPEAAKATEGPAPAADSGDDDGYDGDKTQVVEKPKPATSADAEALTQALPWSPGGASDRTELIPPTPANAPTQAIPKPDLPRDRPTPTGDMAVRESPTGASTRLPKTQPVPQPPTVALPQRTSQPQSGPAETGVAWGQPQQQPGSSRQGVYPNAPASYQASPYTPPGAVRTRDGYVPPGSHYDEFDEYDYDDPARPRGSRKRALLITSIVGVIVVAIAAALVVTKTVTIPGLSAKPVPTVGFSPSGSDAGSDATQTGTAFLTAWQNGNVQAAANITDNPTAALAALKSYKSDLKVSGLTIMPGSATGAGWMTFNVTAQVGAPAAAWSYSSGLAAYQGSVDGVTRWFVKWQPSVLFTSLTAGEKLGIGTIPPTANSVVDRNGTQLTSSNAPSLTNIIGVLEKNAPVGGTPGQKVQIEKADGTVVSAISKVSDPIDTASVKTTLDANIEAAAQTAVNQAANSSMVIIQPSTGNILAIANNPPNGLDTAMLGKYAPGSTFKTITTTLLLNSGKVSDLNQTVPCPATLQADGITLHNSESEVGDNNSFLLDFAASCNNAFSSFHNQVTRDQLVSTAHDYFGWNQPWDVGLGSPTVYGNVPNTNSNSLAEELVGQDRITTSPLVMASVAATVDTGTFKSPTLVPGVQQITGTPMPSSTQSNLKTLMHAVVTNSSGTLAGVFGSGDGIYAKTGTAQVQGKSDNSWTILFKGDYAIAALAVGGGFGAQTAAPEIRSVLGSLN
jgi:Penicillin binding protein transpeptidase domain